MNLFVDSSGWIALFDSNDKYYTRSKNALEKLEGLPVHMVTSDYVFDEAVTYLRYKTGHHVATRFGQWLLTAKHVEMIRINEQVWMDAWKMFQAYDDKEWAFTDCTSFVLMRQHNLWQAFTFDHHFEQAGFQLWPKAGEE